MKKSHIVCGLLLLGLAMVAGGCATTTDYVTLSYVPQATANRLEAAKNVQVSVVIDDQRAVKDRVSAKKNHQGTEIAPIIAMNNVPDAIKGSIEAELRNRGFNLQTGGVTVELTIQKFYNDFQPGFWARKANTATAFKLRVIGSDGSEVLIKNMADEWSKPVLCMSAKRAEMVLDKALRESVQNLFHDADFLNALVK